MTVHVWDDATARAGCCGQTPAALGVGAHFTLDPARATCRPPDADELEALRDTVAMVTALARDAERFAPGDPRSRVSARELRSALAPALDARRGAR